MAEKSIAPESGLEDAGDTECRQPETCASSSGWIRAAPKPAFLATMNKYDRDLRDDIRRINLALTNPMSRRLAEAVLAAAAYALRSRLSETPGSDPRHEPKISP